MVMKYIVFPLQHQLTVTCSKAINRQALPIHFHFMIALVFMVIFFNHTLIYIMQELSTTSYLNYTNCLAARHRECDGFWVFLGGGSFLRNYLK